MEKTERVKFWLESARRNVVVAEDNFKMGHYDWCLFMWHLALEKVMKSIILRNDQQIPFIHNLVLLSRAAEIDLSEDEKMELSEVNTYNVEARYEEIKLALYEKATKQYTEQWVKICKKYYKKFGGL